MNSVGNELRLGQRASGTVYIRCHDSSIIPSSDRSQCHNGQWSPAIPDCAAAANCPPINSSELWIYCSFAGAETLCATPSIPWTIATARCPHQYIQAERSLTCSARGIWKWSGSPLKCRHDCGAHIDDYTAAPWNLQVINKWTGVKGCYAVVFNSVYLSTIEECMFMYNRNATNAAILVRQNDVRDLKPFEKEEYRFAFIKIWPPLRFTKTFMPVCSDSRGVEINDNGFSYTLDLNRSCYKPTYDPNGSTRNASCTVKDDGCMYASGSAFYALSNNEVDGRKRNYIGGNGRRPRKVADDGDGYYRCKLPTYRSFEPEYFID